MRVGEKGDGVVSWYKKNIERYEFAVGVWGSVRKGIEHKSIVANGRESYSRLGVGRVACRCKFLYRIELRRLHPSSQPISS
jgi:hypothetical protein